MAHSLSTQALGTFDLPPYINGPCHQSYGNLSYAAIPHEWMMMNGKHTENGNYCSTNSFGRDEASHGGDNWSRKHCGAEIGDWDGGFILEQCGAKDCFFGCGGSHSSHTRYVGLDKTYGRDWIYDDGQEKFGSARVCGRQSFLESNRFAKLSASFDRTSQSIGLGYHERHASVPSSPTQPIPSRHRRLSEPYNAPTTNQFVPINPSISNAKPLALHDNHSPMKSKDPKPILFKTELCRSWEEKGSCRYGNKCQFAHSPAELRPVPRHPKYKTQLCKTFLEVGSCNYGSRCCFMHSTSSVERHSPKSSVAGKMFS